MGTALLFGAANYFLSAGRYDADWYRRNTRRPSRGEMQSEQQLAPLVDVEDASLWRLQVVSWPAEHGVLAGRLGVRWPKGLLLHGPPGCGKTAAVHAVAHECGAIVHVLTAASVVAPFLGKLPSFMVEGTPSVLRACIMHGTRFTLHTRATHAGEAERRLRAAFAAANRDAQAGCSVIVFLDEASCLF